MKQHKKRYHITYKDKDTRQLKGANIDAKTDIKALKKFYKKHKGVEAQGFECKGRTKHLFR